MHVTRIDDYQSWLVELGECRLLVDPWLTDTFSLPLGRWFFGRTHRSPPVFGPSSVPSIHALVLTSHFADHLDLATLRQLPRDVPVVGSKAAIKVIRGLGFQDLHALSPGDDFVLPGGHRLVAIAPGFPYAYNALGFVFEEATGARAYLETHMVDDRRAEALGPVDLAILPVESVHLLGIQFVMDAERAARAAQKIPARRVTPTGLDPSAAEGWFARWVVRCRGTISDFRRALAGVGPTLVELDPGERYSVESQAHDRAEKSVTR